MSIILNERKAALLALETKELSKKPSETLRCVARYYLDVAEKKLTKRQLKLKLASFLLECEPRASVVKWNGTLDFVVSWAMSHQTILLESIPITEKELATIDALPTTQLRRLAFTLLCLAKYWNEVNPNNHGWVNSKDSEILQMANITTTVKRQCALYAKLKEEGLLAFSGKVDNTNVQVLFAEGKGETVLNITDYRNLGYQYLQYRGESFFQCACCGLTVRESNPKVGRKQKYCKSCAVEVSMKQKVDSAMRLREKEVTA